MVQSVMAGLPPARAEYGDSCSEVQQVHRAVGVAPIEAGVLRLTGPDRVSFLHNISSNDIKSLKPGQGCETLLLTPKGKIQLLLTVLAGAEDLVLIVDRQLTSYLNTFLESALIMEEVSVSDVTADFQFFHLAGPRLADLAGVLSLHMPPDEDMAWLENGGLAAIRRRRSVESGVDLRIPADSASVWFEKLTAAARPLGGGPVGAIAQDILRIEAGIPRFGIDYTTDHFPQEAALEGRAVSFTKGCYTGQEVVARIKTYGGVHRRLVGLVLEVPPPAPGDKVFRDGAAAGHVTSAARSLKFSKSVALAMVSMESAPAGTVVRVGSADGPAATVTEHV